VIRPCPRTGQRGSNVAPTITHSDLVPRIAGILFRVMVAPIKAGRNGGGGQNPAGVTTGDQGVRKTAREMGGAMYAKSSVGRVEPLFFGNS